MNANEHKDYTLEKEKLNNTLEIMEEELYLLKNKTYSMVPKEALPEMIAMDQAYTERLVRNIKKPYFARIDFKEDEEEERKLYIGRMSVMETKDRMCVVDWRAPVSSLYYDSNLGRAEYEAPKGIIGGELLLKRNFEIEEKVLKTITDVDVTSIDEILLDFLEKRKDNKLKDIVSTIQKEQNKIIRADIKDNIIVQGVAGSGKTTIALHRLAYLIYTYRDDFTPDDLMIIAPSRLFLDYISNVLPELGGGDIKQTTIESLTSEIIGESFEIENEDEKTDKEYLKTELSYKEKIDEYLERMINSVVPERDFEFWGISFYDRKKMHSLYHEDYKRYPILKRIDLIRKKLAADLELREDMIAGIIRDEAKLEMEKHPARKNDIYRKELLDIKNIKRDFLKVYDKYYRTPSRSVLDIYNDFRKSIGLLEKNIKRDDIPALLYLKYMLFGSQEYDKIKHIVIDEAQDFGTFMFLALKNIFKESTFCVLGDILQGISEGEGISNWDDLNSAVWESSAHIIELTQSYRTTIEIMNEAEKVISKLKDRRVPHMISVLRHGEEVKKFVLNSYYEIIENIKSDLDVFINKFNTIAIITRNTKSAKNIYEDLKDTFDIELITERGDFFTKKIAILNTRMAKGLEFDCVILADADTYTYYDDYESIKHLYVAITRTLHKLVIYGRDKLTDLLN